MEWTIARCRLIPEMQIYVALFETGLIQEEEIGLLDKIGDEYSAIVANFEESACEGFWQDIETKHGERVIQLVKTIIYWHEASAYGQIVFEEGLRLATKIMNA